MIKQKSCKDLPVVSNPCAPYGAWGLDSCVLVCRHDRTERMERFQNAFKTALSVVDWSYDGTILIAGSITGEVLAWEFATRTLVLANRHAHSYAPISGLSWAPGGRHLVAITMARTIQIWNVATRTCMVLPCQGDTEEIVWELDGSGFRTNDGVVWTEPEGGR